MEKYTTHIKSKYRFYEINIKELIQYKDLIYLFFKRNYTTRYKQTILGPLWLVFNPIITVSLYALVFGRLAGLASDETPHFVFYLCGNALWSFFSTSLIQTSNTFTANAALMGKVYFPRLVMPISAVITALLDLVIQFGLLIIIMIYYFVRGFQFNIGLKAFLIPLIILQVGLLGLGCGIIIASLTTKYRDLSILVGFGVQLWMYATPVVYTTNIIPEQYVRFYMFNPMAAIIECWRNAVIGTEEFCWNYWGISWIVTIIILCMGVLLFNKVEKIFMDTV